MKLKQIFAVGLVAAPAAALAGPTINGAGATFPAPIYQRWFQDYARTTGNRINYQFDSKLINSNFTDEKIDEFSDSFPKLSKEKLFAGSAESENVQKENRVRKLKKRLNELRGLYV